MKIKVRCVSANLQLSPKKEDEVTMFRFVCAEAQSGKPDTAWYEGGLVIYTRELNKYRVGSSYELNVEVA